jgi:RNA polymerase sigma-70 factor (ECF subfamily)|tara:strand:+ start:16330 stop:17754 length:1425 start_codon:yes stop_codon:yes gene_type:complete
MPATLPSLDPALQRCAKKETTGLEQIYRQIAPSIKALALHVLNDEALARQALHDSMVMVWQHASHFNPVHGPAYAWIFSIFRYRLQALQRQTTPDESERIIAAQHWLDNISPCLDHFEPPLRAHLNEQNAQCIVLAYCRGLNSVDIASVLNIDAPEILTDLTTTFNRTPTVPQSGSQAGQALIALYVLGLLDPNQAGAAQSAIAEDDNALKQALYWEGLFFRLTPILAINDPDEQTWEKVQKTLQLTIIPQPLKTPEKNIHPVSGTTDHETQPATPKPQAQAVPDPGPRLSEPEPVRPRKSRKLHILAIAIFLLILVFGLYIWLAPIQSELASHNTAENTENAPPEPLSLHTVVLQPPGSTSTPGWLIVSREPGVLHLEPLLKSQLDTNETLVLWRRKPNSPAIQKLGTIKDNAPSQIRLTSGFSVVEPMLYEITIEQNPAELVEPEGDIAFIGQSFRLQVPDPEPEAPPTRAQ